jgi:chromosome segregation ATPase
LEKHRLLGAELEERAQWAARLDAQLEELRADLDGLHRANARREIEISATCSAYEAKIAALERECEAQARWAMETQQQLNRSVEVLHETERTLAERTAWAQRLDSELESCKARIALVEASRWVRLGRAFGIGPAARQE